MTLSIDPLSGRNGSYANLVMAAGASSRSTAVQKEFLTIFYKELLKQAFKAPDLSIGDKDENNFVSSFGSDAMIEQLAQEMARRAVAAEPVPGTEGGR